MATFFPAPLPIMRPDREKGEDHETGVRRSNGFGVRRRRLESQVLSVVLESGLAIVQVLML